MGNGAVEFEKTRINLWHVGVLAIGLATNAAAIGMVWTDTKRDIQDVSKQLDDLNDYRRSRAANTDANFAAINARLQPFETYTFRLTQSEVRLGEVDRRIDRVVETIGTKLDTLNDTVNRVSTDVRVLAQKVDMNMKDAKPVSFKPGQL